MQGRKRAGLALVLSMAFLFRASVASALLSDEKNGKWNLLGKFKTQASFRTTETPPNNPIPIEAGDMTTQRSLLFLEFKQDLGLVKPWLQLGYYVEGRAYYDGVWDYGPAIFSDDDVRRKYLFDNRDQINDLKWDAELYMGYVDITSGPAFLRIGRQVLSWGEMSTFRVLDGINPLDNSTLAVDLLERLVPLGMIRGNLAFDNVGPFNSLSLQAYYVNGTIDNTNGEDMIDGSPIFPPIGRDTLTDLQNPFSLASLKQNVRQVEDNEIDSDRYGLKLGFLWEGLNLNLAYCRMYSDTPVPAVDSSSFKPVHLTWSDFTQIDTKNPIGWLFGGQKLDVLLKLDTVDVLGSSFNYNWALIDTVLRGEIAYQIDVPKMTPGSIKDMLVEVGGKIFLPRGASLADLLANVPLEGGPVLPFSTGKLDKFDILKYGFGLDKWVKIPALSREDFLVMLEYVGSTNLDWKEKTILIPWQSPDGKTLYETKFSNTFFLITQTNYMAGNLTPQLVMIYEVEPQALSLIPSIKYQWRNFEFDASYMFTVSDSYIGTTGMLRSRDEVTFSVGYNF